MQLKALTVTGVTCIACTQAQRNGICTRDQGNCGLYNKAVGPQIFMAWFGIILRALVRVTGRWRPGSAGKLFKVCSWGGDSGNGWNGEEDFDERTLFREPLHACLNCMDYVALVYGNPTRWGLSCTSEGHLRFCRNESIWWLGIFGTPVQAFDEHGGYVCSLLTCMVLVR